MENPYSHLIKDPNKQEWLVKLVSEAEEAKKRFEHEQQKIDNINANLERNHAMISALEEENRNLEAQANQTNVDQYGAIDFSGYDVLSGEVFKNNGKIEKIKEVIARFEKERDLIIYTTWKDTEKEMRMKARDVYDYAGRMLLDELLEENGEKLQRIFTLLYQWSGSSEINEQPAFMAIKNAMKPYLQYDSDLKKAVFKLPSVNREVDNKVANTTLLSMKKEVVRLKQELGKA